MSDEPNNLNEEDNEELEDQEEKNEKKEEDQKKEEFVNEYADMDKKEVPYFEKQKGTESFSQKDYMAAIKHYSKSLLAYQFLVKDQKITAPEEFKKFKNEIQIPVNLNLTQCYMKMEDYKTATSFVETALKLDGNNLKGLYRRGICYMRTGEFQKARLDFTKAQNIEPDNKDIQNAFKELDLRISKQKDKEIKMVQKMMKGLDYSDINKDKQSPTGEGFFKKMKDGIQKMLSKIFFCKKKKNK